LRASIYRTTFVTMREAKSLEGEEVDRWEANSRIDLRDSLLTSPATTRRTSMSGLRGASSEVVPALIVASAGRESLRRPGQAVDYRGERAGTRLLTDGA